MLFSPAYPVDLACLQCPFAVLKKSGWGVVKNTEINT